MRLVEENVKYDTDRHLLQKDTGLTANKLSTAMADKNYEKEVISCYWTDDRIH